MVASITLGSKKDTIFVQCLQKKKKCEIVRPELVHLFCSLVGRKATKKTEATPQPEYIF